MRRTKAVLAVILGAALYAVAADAEPIAYGVADWPETPFGNRRAILHVADTRDGDVKARVEWRRNDPSWEKKGLLLFDRETGKQVCNAYVVRADRVSADIVFQADTVPGEYEVYYMPYVQPARFHSGWPGRYLPPMNIARTEWLNRHGFNRPRSLASRVLGEFGTNLGFEDQEIVCGPGTKQFSLIGAVVDFAGNSYTVAFRAAFDPAASAQCNVVLLPNGYSRSYSGYRCTIAHEKQGATHVLSLQASGPRKEPATSDEQRVVFDAATPVTVTCRADVQPARTIIELVGEYRDAEGQAQRTSVILEDTSQSRIATGRGPVFDTGGGGCRIGSVSVRDSEGAEVFAGPTHAEPGPAGTAWREFPEAEVVRFEARGEFNRFSPMEVIASPEETAGLIKQFPERDLLTFPEDRLRPIRMIDFIPLKWSISGPSDRFEGHARPGEYYTFQVGLFTPRNVMTVKEVEFSDLRGPGNQTIPAGSMTCFNVGGIDFTGRRPFKVALPIAPSKVCPLWIGIPVAPNLAGVFEGGLRIRTADGGSYPIRVAIDVTGAPAVNHGDDDPRLHTRMRWLNSDLGTDPEEVPPPYVPVQREGNRVDVLGRRVVFGSDGLPQSIRSFGHDLLAAPIRLELAQGVRTLTLKHVQDAPDEQTPSYVKRETRLQADQCAVTVRTHTEFDGIVDLHIGLVAETDLKLDDLALVIPMRLSEARYMMGFSRPAGAAPDSYAWNWNPKTVNNVGWIGRVRAGLGLKLLPRDPDLWDMRNFADFDLYSEWYNRGRGGVDFLREPGAYLVKASTGPFQLSKGKSISLRFRLFVTPFKPLNPEHWYDHGAAGSGSTVRHVHHANTTNPFINYPFMTVDRIVDLHNMVKAQGMKGINLYYTCREISFIAPELFAWRSLAHQPLVTRGAWVYSVEGETIEGSGGGYPWLQEHLTYGYSPAWTNSLPGADADAAVGVNPNGRLLNYYIEGVNFFKQRMNDVGIYLDGIGFGRRTSQRLVRVLSRNNPEYRIVYHTGDLGNLAPGGGYRQENRFCPMARHMEHLPYMSKLMFGEGFEFNEGPDYWLLELSGLPFGLSNEFYVTDMPLESKHEWAERTRYNALLYGGCSILHASGGPVRDFLAAWKVDQAEMIGYWEDDCPVRTGMADVLATVYRKSGETMIALASWRESPVDVRLKIDYARLGLDPDGIKWYAPDIRKLQEFQVFQPGKTVRIEGRGGCLMIASPVITEFARPRPRSAEVLKAREGMLWGDPNGAGSEATAGKARTLGGRSPDRPVTITAVSVYLLGRNPIGSLRLAIYGGGSLERGPHAEKPAELLCDLAEISKLKSGWNTFALPEQLKVAPNSTIWVAWKGSYNLQLCYREAPPEHAGFQTDRGRWESGAIDVATDVAWPDSWPADPSGAFGDSWYSFCLHMK